MGLPDAIIFHGIRFGRTTLGLVTRPYETYRSITDRGGAGELVYVSALLLCYFALASLVKVSEFRPFLLTKQFLVLGLGAGSGAILSILLISIFGNMLGSKVRVGSVIMAWGYTLIPTVIWFLATSLLYVVLPPPRTASIAGILFSMLFLVFSATLLWWKITLVYLTLRFTLRLNLGKCALVALFSAPFLMIWSIMMYTLGIFKVPFI